jgi:hypothetical protein
MSTNYEVPHCATSNKDRFIKLQTYVNQPILGPLTMVVTVKYILVFQVSLRCVVARGIVRIEN